MEIIRYYNDCNLDYNELLNVLHESFEERLQQGLEFSCSKVTLEQMINGYKDSYIVIAKEQGNIIGYVRLKIVGSFAHFGPIAILSSYKGKGVGSELFKEAEKIVIEQKCNYLQSDTACKAISSVKFHLKNGFKIWGLASYGKTNYYSYVFRKWYKNRYLGIGVISAFHYYLSYIKCHIFFNQDGTLTKIGSVILK